MMQSLRDQSGKWFIKVLFGAIIASFGIFGVSDLVRGYGAMKPLATVGKHSITYEEFSHNVHQQTARLQQAAKGKLRPDDLKQLGIHTQILEQLIDQSVIDQEVGRLKLAVSDSLVRNHVHSMRAFRNESGVFDKDLFNQILHSNNLTEAKFLSEIRSSLLDHQLIGTLSAGVMLPKFYLEALFQGLEEKREFVSVSIPASKMTLKAEPTEEELKVYFEQNKAQFTIPEYRAISLLRLDPKAMQKNIVITQEEVAQEYERRKPEFTEPERRAVGQLTYATEKLAKEAVARLNVGRPMAAAARDVPGGTFKDLGTLTHNELPEKIVAQVFSLAVGKNTGAIEGALGWQIYQVSKIEPETTKSLEEVKVQVDTDLRSYKLGEYLHQTKNKIEDALAGGATLTEVTQTYGLVIETIPSVDNTGLDAANKPVLAMMEPELRSNVVEQAFATAEGMESPITEIKDGYAIIVRVDKALPSYVPEFSEAKSKVTKAWTDEKRLQAAGELAQTFIKDVKSINDLDSFAKTHKLELTQLAPFGRADADKDTKIRQGFSSDILRRAFILKPGQAAASPSPDGFTIIMLKRISPFNIANHTEKFEIFTKNINAMAQKDLLASYVQGLRQAYNVKINQEALNKAID
jgi:peptidyl-prolyl cis-trans isomerase D